MKINVGSENAINASAFLSEAYLEFSFDLDLGGGQDALYPVFSDSDSGNGWNTIIHPVPIPSAIWLFGSALLGLVGMKGKKLSA